MRYLLLCGLILGLLTGNCEAVACQRIQEECVYKTLVFNINEEATDLKITVVTTDWDGEERTKVIYYTLDADEGLVELRITETVSIQNVKWYVEEIDPETKVARRPYVYQRANVATVPDMECQCGSWGTLEVYYHGEFDEVRP